MKHSGAGRRYTPRPMPESTIRLWPGVPDLAALGARGFDDLIGASGALDGEERGEVVATDDDRVVLRYPLPGTVTRAGERAGRPRGAGTGFVYLTRWRAGSLRDKTAARLSAPRSASFAARAWNLICHLREYGVGTAEPLAMGEESAALFANRSFLATRELEAMQPLTDYVAHHRDATTRRRLAHAVGLMLARVFEARVDLPRLSLASLFVSRLDAGEACAAQKIAESLGHGEAHDDSPVPGLEKRPLPELALATVNGGRLLERFDERQALASCERLLAQVDEAWQLDPRELLRVFHYSIGRRMNRDRKRQILERFTSEVRTR